MNKKTRFYYKTKYQIYCRCSRMFFISLYPNGFYHVCIFPEFAWGQPFGVKRLTGKAARARRNKCKYSPILPVRTRKATEKNFRGFFTQKICRRFSFKNTCSKENSANLKGWGLVFFPHDFFFNQILHLIFHKLTSFVVRANGRVADLAESWIRLSRN